MRETDAMLAKVKRHEAIAQVYAKSDNVGSEGLLLVMLSLSIIAYGGITMKIKKVVAIFAGLSLLFSFSANAFASTGHLGTWIGFPQTNQGANNPYVKCIQRIMYDYSDTTRLLIVNNGGVDGSFGSATKQAVKLYQAGKGLTADGSVGSQTWGKIDNDLDYDSIAYFSSDGYFEMFIGTGLQYTNYDVRRGTVSGSWGVRLYHPAGASYATNGTYQVFHS